MTMPVWSLPRQKTGTVWWLIALPLAVLVVAPLGCTKKPSQQNITVVKSNGAQHGLAAIPLTSKSNNSLSLDNSHSTPFSSDDLAPTVVLSEAHAKACLVKVGDRMPNVMAIGLDGGEYDTASLLDDALTVFVFWNSRLVFAREQFARLEQEILSEFGSQGVKVVAINVGDPPEKIAAIMKTEPHQRVLNLFDDKKQCLEMIGGNLLPRTYVLDSDGIVLWMDVEYSRSTRRGLRTALAHYLRAQR